MNHWILKTEPGTYSFDDLMREKRAVWDGIRNPQARKNLEAMSEGDKAFIYHTGSEKRIVGLAEVVRKAYPDVEDDRWRAVDLKPAGKLNEPVDLGTIKKNAELGKTALVRQGRLSVVPLTSKQAALIYKLAKQP